jgi:hypothetical protein
MKLSISLLQAFVLLGSLVASTKAESFALVVETEDPQAHPAAVCSIKDSNLLADLAMAALSDDHDRSHRDLQGGRSPSCDRLCRNIARGYCFLLYYWCLYPNYRNRALRGDAGDEEGVAEYSSPIDASFIDHDENSRKLSALGYKQENGSVGCAKAIIRTEEKFLQVVDQAQGSLSEECKDAFANSLQYHCYVKN